ncbi:MAG: hypothetical protein ACRD37_08790, partial [Candidatus Acidiferrales bacterium]
MVAFEAATLEEKAGRNDEAIRWYTVAAERFRRADWRLKAGEALTRLGAPVPEAVSSSSLPAASDSASVPEESEISGNVATAAESEPSADGGDSVESVGSADSEIAPGISAAVTKEGAAPARPGERHGRRRGRRGGRRHKRHGAAGETAKPSLTRTPVTRTQLTRNSAPPRLAESVFAVPSRPVPEAESEPVVARFVPEPSGPLVERSTYIRAGDPALASRFAQLESMLRRLISAPLHRVDELEEAPAGPGVFLLSDSDLMTNYYVEACQTLRIGTSQLARAGRAGRGARTEGKASLRAQMAEHLSINDTQVTAYLGKHCVVRWLQLDEDAPHLAHFAIALLRPALNVE